jgi:conflict system STAND superfamily ATPase
MDDLARDERALHLHLRRLFYARGVPRARSARSDSQMLLVVDQFEELFTLCRGEAERQAFIKNLLLAAAPPAEPTKPATAIPPTVTPVSPTAAPTNAPQSTATVPIAEHPPLAAATAEFQFPVDIAIDADDNLYISDCVRPWS